jgi:hypothetical protein
VSSVDREIPCRTFAAIAVFGHRFPSLPRSSRHDSRPLYSAPASARHAEGAPARVDCRPIGVRKRVSAVGGRTNPSAQTHSLHCGGFARAAAWEWRDLAKGRPAPSRKPRCAAPTNPRRLRRASRSSTGRGHGIGSCDDAVDSGPRVPPRRLANDSTSGSNLLPIRIPPELGDGARMARVERRAESLVRETAQAGFPPTNGGLSGSIRPRAAQVRR